MDIILTALDEYIYNRRQFNSKVFDLPTDCVEIKIANRLLIINERNRCNVKKCRKILKFTNSPSSIDD